MAKRMKPKKQTDYGNMYFKQPRAIYVPGDVRELAETLKTCNANRELVTVRNTHHSTNGQTLTDAVQIDLSRLNAVRFDGGAMKVTAGPGTPWNDVLKAIGLPTNCTPMFPNNPRQRIRIGGTAAVGGVGYYGSSVGGFWNHVTAMKLVTMTGEVVECSRTQQADLFRYSLGGFGRLGVMAELTVDVVRSKPYVLGMVLAYRDDEIFNDAFQRALNDEQFQGVAAQEDLSNWQTDELKLVGINLKLLVVLVELGSQDQVKPVVRQIRERYPHAISLFLKAGDKRGTLDATFEQNAFPKQDVIYFYPTQESFIAYLINRVTLFLFGKTWLRTPHDPNLKYPWCDCIINRAHYTEFVTEAKKLLAKHGLAKTLEKQSMFHGLINVDSFVTFGLKRMTKDFFFPVTLDLPNEPQHALGVAIMPNVRADQLKEATALGDELTALVYALGGRRYLYGYHKLTPDQVVQHFGGDVILEWQRLKRQCDPNQLLNIGVIEHLDTADGRTAPTA